MSINYEELERKRNLEVYVDNLSNEDVFAAFNDVFDIKAKFQDVKFSWDGDFKLQILELKINIWTIYNKHFYHEFNTTYESRSG